MSEIITYGDYKGKTLEQIALSDYYHFFNAFVQDNILSPKRREEVAQIYLKLNDFAIDKKCQDRIDGCEKDARVMGVLIETEYGSVHTSEVPACYCGRDHYESNAGYGTGSSHYAMLPIEFNSLLGFGGKHKNKTSRKILAKLLGQYINLDPEKKKTRQYVSSIFRGIESRSLDTGESERLQRIIENTLKTEIFERKQDDFRRAFYSILRRNFLENKHNRLAVLTAPILGLKYKDALDYIHDLVPQEQKIAEEGIKEKEPESEPRQQKLF